MKSLHVALLLTIASFTVEAQEKQQLPDDLIPYTDEAVETDLSEEELENLAFEIFLQRKFNMTPEQLRKFAEMKKQESEALKRKKPAIPIRTIDSIDLSPGAKPYVIHTTQVGIHIYQLLMQAGSLGKLSMTLLEVQKSLRLKNFKHQIITR